MGCVTKFSVLLKCMTDVPVLFTGYTLQPVPGQLDSVTARKQVIEMFQEDMRNNYKAMLPGGLRGSCAKALEELWDSSHAIVFAAQGEAYGRQERWGDPIGLKEAGVPMYSELADNERGGNHAAMTPRSRKWCAVANLELAFGQQMFGEVDLANASVGAGLAVENGTCPVCRADGVSVHLVNLGNIDGQSVVSLMCEDCYVKWQQAVQPYKTSNEGRADATE